MMDNSYRVDIIIGKHYVHSVTVRFGDSIQFSSIFLLCRIKSREKLRSIGKHKENQRLRNKIGSDMVLKQV